MSIPRSNALRWKALPVLVTTLEHCYQEDVCTSFQCSALERITLLVTTLEHCYQEYVYNSFQYSVLERITLLVTTPEHCYQESVVTRNPVRNIIKPSAV